ncbi:MAG: NHLP leader peptide family natural product precursor [Richelia sp. RM2_1_2]|nr:NHLP leader peptide family natural product precursor [Richelia sp. SM1_7_0]NJN10445.1 NHLP leader peptide family natural product precursor [Richelia sp. RM1_1_1]NJO62791.1 NHLP leader peptide family natural product precursor [Richelia sp. RM2_1_2]
MSEQTPQTLEARIVSRALQDASFKQQLLNGSVAAKAAIEQEIGQHLPEDLEVRVLEEKTQVSYIILPSGVSNEGMSQEQLEAIAGGRRISSSRIQAVTTTLSIPCTLGSATIRL